MRDAAGTWRQTDPFDLPDWLGSEELTWCLEGHMSAAVVRGRLRGAAGHDLALDIVCADVAYPAPPVDELARRECHLAWHHGEVLVLGSGERIAVGVPASRLDADLACEGLRRFARAVAVEPGMVKVLIAL